MWGLAGVTYLYNSVCLCYVLQLKYGDRFVMKPPDCSTKIIESSVARITFICRGLRNVGVPWAPCLKKKTRGHLENARGNGSREFRALDFESLF